jgi:hypothetical protein
LLGTLWLVGWLQAVRHVLRDRKGTKGAASLEQALDTMPGLLITDLCR